MSSSLTSLKIAPVLSKDHFYAVSVGQSLSGVSLWVVVMVAGGHPCCAYSTWLKTSPN